MTNNRKKPIRWGMVGGGKGSQIGYIHRSAAHRDDVFVLVAGAFDIDPERGRAFGLDLGLDEARSYRDYATMFAAEAGRADGIEAVSIATPNNTHFAICKAALEHDLHVICEKPLCFTIAEAEELKTLSQARGRIVGVTYGYAGHQMIEQARAMVRNGDLGEIRVVNLQFAHGFHSAAVEEQNPSTRWRVDPKFAGPSYVLGDVGTHPLYIAKVILPHLKIRRLLCTRQSFVKSRAPLEDNAVTLMEYDNGAIATIWSSAVNAGSMHGQKIRIVGSKASIEWWDERPNQLSYEIQGEPARILERGMDYLYPEARIDDRIGGGHPEGLFEAWANLYRRFGFAINRERGLAPAGIEDLVFPDVDAGLEGVRWVENCVRSADAGGIWLDYR
ncbi:Gfo/Idh/MocA family protein [Rhizobium leguminosarum]|uniref:Gfo/Idh/MocA family oxidoreductase n=1 Tax=Rhizobium leguminosarum TaxID=384 RepID=A0A444I841_RHILE|nr:Gfo/Idh/MocA family oxidoreductase [Rhizobium leguminosarum]MDH6659395.1 putative dehydrogenase [Rhizobium sophorae]ASS53772.1 gfo/Idh/MocA family oxidoreductase [Rhizobium leguminosarum bv. viciae]AVC48986.1 oxidoreductase family, C-terminal alpha/beta domain protein [Rhizobium leguminosarum bv. viciae]MBB4327554.1 putative dehydrogenase [Rhizobium leguminosarum]MBB4340882.1 putative dehydrogenase [Rhizobium leguminosarum]